MLWDLLVLRQTDPLEDEGTKLVNDHNSVRLSFHKIIKENFNSNNK